MKRLLASAISILGMVAMALSVAPATATAAGAYPGTIATNCTASLVSTVVRGGNRIRLNGNVTAAGNAQPQGTFSIISHRADGNVTKRRNQKYSGGAVTTGGAILYGPTRWIAQMRYTPAEGSVYEACSKTVYRIVRVKR